MGFRDILARPRTSPQNPRINFTDPLTMRLIAHQNDMVMWLIDEARSRGSSAESIMNKIMAVNFAAIHTSSQVSAATTREGNLPNDTLSSQSITHALIDLAAYPEYLKPLREEIDAAVQEGGWTKESVAKMWKLDSFLRESQRMNGISASTL